MSTFQIVSRTAPLPTPPKRRSRRLNRGWATAIRVFISINIAALLFVMILSISHSDYTFVLLPTFLSLLTVGSRRYSLSIILDSTPLYLVFTFLLALIYYGFITEGVLLTHFASNTDHIILVAATLAWTIINEPVRTYLQSLIEQRFNVRYREKTKAVETFTSTLREEINLDQLRERFLTVIQQTMKPYSVALWVHTTVQQKQVQAQADTTKYAEFSISGNDPFVVYALRHPGTLEIDRLQLTSLLLQNLKARGIVIALPLASQGELIGLLTLGPRLDGEEYTRQDLILLNALATQVAPAVRVAQMVQEQQEQMRERERIEQELRTAQTIQHAFLPKEVPALAGWQLVPYYQPAREVGGDFYDFIALEDARLGLIIGDVTGKGVPAALVMATVHTMLRSASQASTSPAEILARVNDLLAAEIPTGMFVTCFYGLLDPQNGKLRFANAGHEAPYRLQGHNASELWATGMPLGMLPGSAYEEHETTLEPGENLFFYSDGLVEAHNPSREIFGFPRLQTLLAEHTHETSLIDFIRGELQSFTGKEWEQEDDVTLVTLQRMPETLTMNKPALLWEVTIASTPGNEQQAIEWMTEVVCPLHLPPDRLDNLKAAVAEAIMNAMEHGNHYSPDKSVVLQVLVSATSVVVRIRDQGVGKLHPILNPEAPDLAAKLAGRETSRGWGLFLIKKLVDELHVINNEHSHTIEVIIYTAASQIVRDSPSAP